MDLNAAVNHSLRVFQTKARLIHRETWQGLSVQNKPDMATYELVGHSLIARLGNRDLNYYQRQIRPDLPWADDHFEERVSGKPLNPPPSEEWWPHAPTGNSAFKHEGIFSHTYPERYWPKLAGRPNPYGIRYPYGDLQDLVELLQRTPLTRQAYLPVWFPEDTGNVLNVRTPCTLGYHFLVTADDELDVTYYIRSCDLLRHFRNDIYLTVRLLLWIMDRLSWDKTKPGNLRMHITSLHCFRNDMLPLFGERR